MIVQLDKITTLIDELKTSGYEQVDREKSNKRKYNKIIKT
jgi:hypothetical protein